MCRLGLTPRRVTSALGRTNSTLVGANVSSISTSTSNATSFSAAPSRLAFSLPRARSRWLACGSLLWDACPFPISGCPFSRGVPRFSRSFWRPTHTSCEWIFALPCFSPCFSVRRRRPDGPIGLSGGARCPAGDGCRKRPAGCAPRSRTRVRRSTTSVCRVWRTSCLTSFLPPTWR